ncbi:MAG: virulence RhuM family protein [Bifidobacteriaceae bacterium]|nr:virulence RhuM family protein [Bifidobacteriaceae bacterium]
MELDNFLFYTTPDGNQQIEAYFYDETVWLTQKKMAELFEVGRAAVAKHLKNIFDSGELDESSVSSKMEHTANDNKIYNTTFYNLDAIISVGYRVNSTRAIDFRKWATKALRSYLIKGYILDDERLKNGTHFGKDYFEELLEKIREIRLSERRLHLKLADIFALSSDYKLNTELTKEFFAFIQNKLHYAITGNTAAELIYKRVDKNKKHMGLTNWKQSPNGKILKSDVIIAKNYLTENELKKLARAVSAFLDIAENRAERQSIMTMKDWLGVMNDYLDLNEYPKLLGTGKVSQKKAKQYVISEYEQFRIKQDKDFVGDFEKFVKKIEDR